MVLVLRDRIRRGVEEARGKLSFIGSLLDPVRAIVSPGRYYSSLRGLLDRYGVYAVSTVYFASWLGTSIITFILILLIETFRGLRALSISGIATAPLKALAYSLAFPIVAALIDAVIILVILAFFPRKRPLYDVFAVRASSLLPYGLRVVLLEITGRLSFTTLIAATTSRPGLALLAIGTILTIYGLRRTMGASLAGAVIAGAAPLAYKLLLGFHLL